MHIYQNRHFAGDITFWVPAVEIDIFTNNNNNLEKKERQKIWNKVAEDKVLLQSWLPAFERPRNQNTQKVLI